MSELSLNHYAIELGRRLTRQRLTLSVAESCTGGLICHQITNVPGSSLYFCGGIVAYTNQIKVQLLGVPPKVIQQWGAVSAPTAEQMVRQVAHLFDTPCAIAVSGIAGPTGGSTTKPVGLVWVASLTPEGISTQEYHFTGEREQIKHQAAYAALKMLLDNLE